MYVCMHVCNMCMYMHIYTGEPTYVYICNIGICASQETMVEHVSRSVLGKCPKEADKSDTRLTVSCTVTAGEGE